MNKKNITSKYFLIFLIISIWIIGSHFSLWNSYIIPYPEKVFLTTIKLLKNGELFKHMATSISRIFLGFSVAVFLGIPSAIIFGMFPKIYNYFKIILEFMRHTPPPCSYTDDNIMVWNRRIFKNYNNNFSLFFSRFFKHIKRN